MTDRIRVLGDPKSKNVFIQMVDDHDLEYMDSLTAELEKQAGSDWCLVTVKVNSWNQDLTPWEAPPVFGNEGFGDGAEETLKLLLEEVIPKFEKEQPADSVDHEGEEKYPAEGRRYFIAGYSLAGLFALWAGYSCDVFSGVVAASPSVWYPGWIDFVKSHEFKAGHAYLSLGDKESRTRNQVMAKVGENIESQQEVLCCKGVECVLEWNPGNHFRDPDKRTARGMAWMLEKLK